MSYQYINKKYPAGQAASRYCIANTDFLKSCADASTGRKKIWFGIKDDYFR